MSETLKHCPFCNCWLSGAGGDGSRSHPQSRCILSNWIITPQDAKSWNSRPIEDVASSLLTASEARVTALEKALREIEGLSGLDNEIAGAGCSVIVADRMASIHQIAGSLLP